MCSWTASEHGGGEGEEAVFHFVRRGDPVAGTDDRRGVEVVGRCNGEEELLLQGNTSYSIEHVGVGHCQ